MSRPDGAIGPDRAWAGWWIAFVAALFYARFGYAYGVGDHDEMIPQLLRMLDPSLFPQDWYLQGEAGRVSVRTPFLLALRAMAVPFGVEGGVFALWLLVLVGVALGVWGLARQITGDQVAAALATLGAVAVTPLWALGGNGLVAPLLVPEPVAWALALPAVGLFMRGRPHHRLTAGALLGVAGLFQLLVGTLTVGALGLVWLWEIAADRERRERWLPEIGRAVGFGLVYLLVASPIFLPTALAQTASSPAPDDGLSLFYVIAQLRQPHHYLFAHFGERVIAQVGLLVVLGGLSLSWLGRRQGRREAVFVRRLLVVIGALCGVALVGTEGLQILFVAKLQFYKLTVLATVLLVTAVAAACVAAVPEGWKERAEAALAHPWGWAVALLAVGAVTGLGLGGWKNGPAQHRASDLYAVEAWARQHTRPDALFLIPPSETTFRTWARRSVAINWKPTPFRDAAMRERLARLRTVAPSAELPALGVGWKETLDAAYHQNTRATWHRLHTDWGADYALVEVERLGTPPADQPAFRSGRWAVYPLAPSGGRP